MGRHLAEGGILRIRRQRWIHNVALSLLLATASLALLAAGKASGGADASAATNAASAESARPSVPQPASESATRLRSSVGYLASDELEGRGIGTNGIDLAANYIAARFAEIGLRTDLCDGTAFQHFMRRSRLDLGSTNAVSLVAPDGEKLPLGLREDFTPLSLSGSGRFDLPVVFVGYGITDTTRGYDDYAGIDVKGKAAIILRHEPNRPQAGIAESPSSDHAYFGRKVVNALEHGAAAILLVNDLNEIRKRAAERRIAAADLVPNDPELDQLLGFQTRTKFESRNVPVIHCRRGAIDHMVRASLGGSLRELEEKIDADRAPASSELSGWKIAGEVSVLEKGKSLKNVVGLLEGVGPLASETVIIGAHYDHLGYGGWGSLAFASDNEIHNGADDNASGTAVLIEIARRLAELKQTPRRQVLFIAFTAEEMGLVGSEYYVSEPVVALKDTVAMLNLDMVGRLRRDRISVQGTGTASLFEPLVDGLCSKYGLDVAKQRGGYGPSDHSTFYEHGIPVMHFFTGLHADYHRPSDDTDKLNVEGMERIAGFVQEVAAGIITSTERPQLVRPELTLADLRDIEGAAISDDSEPVVPQAPYFGVAADRSREAEGYLVGRVMEGSAAERAGIQSGDLILRVGDTPVKEAKELPLLIAKLKAGETVPVSIRRGTLELEIDVTLSPR